MPRRGPGYPENILCLECHNVGFDLVKNIVRKSLHGTVSLFNDNGVVTVVQFRAQVH
jgi:two-component sensor histidine kinase